MEWIQQIGRGGGEDEGVFPGMGLDKELFNNLSSQSCSLCSKSFLQNLLPYTGNI